MLRSIRVRLLLALIVMTTMLGVLVYLVSGQLRELDTTMADLHDMQEVKSHVLIPQKDMNEFLARMETTVLLLEMGEADEAQKAFDDSVDAEQDIAAEFALLKQDAPEELLPNLEQAHLEWEVATEFLKLLAIETAEERDLTLVRPETPDKSADDHTAEAIERATSEYGGKSAVELAALQEEVVEVADEAIDVSEEKADEMLASFAAEGDESLDATERLTMMGLAVVLLGVLLAGVPAVLSTVRPLLALKEGAEHVASGDLDYEFKRVKDNEIGAVVKAVGGMAQALKSRIRNLEEVAGIVVLTGDEIGSAAGRMKAGQGSAEDLDDIIGKAEVLKDLVGQMLSDPASPSRANGGSKAA